MFSVFVPLIGEAEARTNPSQILLLWFIKKFNFLCYIWIFCRHENSIANCTNSYYAVLSFGGSLIIF
jgi:hypothetical protein